MCGIVGYVGEEQARSFVLEGLKRLEFRGYDSTGIATINSVGKFELQRATGKLEELLEKVKIEPCTGTIAIGHNRWATHGKPEDRNAHPHVVEGVAVVHNGIIENYAELRAALENDGCVFSSETDTEVIPHLINSFKNWPPIFAIVHTVARLKGAFALAIMFESDPNTLFAVRKNQPLVIGFGSAGSFVASSELAFASVVTHITHLENEDIAIVTASGASVVDFSGQRVERALRPLSIKDAAVSKGPYRHFLLKEIYEQPEAVGGTLRFLSDSLTHNLFIPNLPFYFGEIDRLMIIGCGTAYHAGLIGKYWFESLAGLPTDCEVASEFGYRDPAFSPKQAAIFLSQSGETRDTIAALEYVKGRKLPSLAVINAVGSSLARLADKTLYTDAYPEISVASTKVFTSQLAVLASLAVSAASARGTFHHGSERESEILRAFDLLPSYMQEVISLDGQLQELSKVLSGSKNVFYIGRGTSYPLALEGALKLKEISYIHAEGYAAGELKHGPLALIDDKVLTVVIAPPDRHFDKTASNLEEIITRGGKVILLSDEEGCKKLSSKVVGSIALPKVDSFVSPFVYAVALQLLAYHTAVLRGTDVDQPRNLAKSVTVE